MGNDKFAKKKKGLDFFKTFLLVKLGLLLQNVTYLSTNKQDTKQLPLSIVFELKWNVLLLRMQK